jgi:TRAP-type C4-dicarboxylate transport system permease small subunit
MVRAGTVKKGLIKALEFAVILLMAALVLDVVWQVFTRFAMNDPSKWTEELANVLLVWVGLLGASLGFVRHVHLGVDFFVNKIEGRARHVVDITVLVLVMFFAGAVLVYGGGSKVIHMLSLPVPKVTPALQIKQAYFFIVLPLSGFFIVLASLDELIGKVRLLAESTTESPRGDA